MFYDIFKDQNIFENMEVYLVKVFYLEQLERELVNLFLDIYFVYFNDELVGYLKVNVNDV